MIYSIKTKPFSLSCNVFDLQVIKNYSIYCKEMKMSQEHIPAQASEGPCSKTKCFSMLWNSCSPGGSPAQGHPPIGHPILKVIAVMSLCCCNYALILRARWCGSHLGSSCMQLVLVMPATSQMADGRASPSCMAMLKLVQEMTAHGSFL